MSPTIPPDTRRFLSVFYQVSGDPDPVTTLRSFMTRQSLLRSRLRLRLRSSRR